MTTKGLLEASGAALRGHNVLVTGATGFTGACLVRKLVRVGAKVTAIARESSDVDQFGDLEIDWVRGDVFDEATVEAAMKNKTFVFHVAAAFREAKVSDETYHLVHVQSTQLLARRALENPGFSRFVHVSTIGVHGHIENPPADENYRFGAGDIYQETKAAAELWIREFATEKGLPLTVVRPAAIYGPGDRRLLKVFRLASKKIFPIIGYGKCLYHLIHVDDLTDFFMVAASHRATLGEVLICGNTEHIPLTRLVQMIGEAYRVRVRVVRVPAWPVFLAADLCELVCRPFGIEPPIYRRRIAFFTKDRSFDTRKMKKLTGFVPKWNNEAGVRETAHWYAEKGWI